MAQEIIIEENLKAEMNQRKRNFNQMSDQNADIDYLSILRGTCILFTNSVYKQCLQTVFMFRSRLENWTNK